MTELMDWRDVTRTDKIIVQMVDPTNIDAVMGELEGVDLKGSSITACYYTDTRVSAKLKVVGNGWIRGTFLRIIYSIPEWNWSTELGTFLVTGDNASRDNGQWVTELTLQSMLFGLSTDKLVRPWAIAKNAMILKATAQCLNAAGRKHNLSGAADHRLKATRVIETGTDRLKTLFAFCQLTNNRLDVDGHGRVTMTRYVAPATKAPLWRIDLADARGVALDGLSRSSDFLQVPNVVGVCYKYNVTQNGKSVQKEINARAIVPANSPHSSSRRGYTITDFREVNELSPATAARAQQLANTYLQNDQREHVEWELSTIYLPLWEGDVVDLVVPDGERAYQGTRRCMVKNVEINLGTMGMKLTLKEVASGDDE